MKSDRKNVFKIYISPPGRHLSSQFVDCDGLSFLPRGVSSTNWAPALCSCLCRTPQGTAQVTVKTCVFQARFRFSAIHTPALPRHTRTHTHTHTQWPWKMQASLQAHPLPWTASLAGLLPCEAPRRSSGLQHFLLGSLGSVPEGADSLSFI